MERDSKLNEVFDVVPMPKTEVVLTPLDDEEKDLQNVHHFCYN